MNITNRLFAYPVLSDEKNDYKQSVFRVKYEQSKGVNDLQLSFDIEMTCQELQDMILNGQAEYVVHLECKTTAYRKTQHSMSPHIDYKIPLGRINGTLEAAAFIVLKQRVKAFFCTDWVEDFAGMTFDLSQGSILAYENLDSLDVSKEYEEFSNAESIFSVYKRLTDEDKPAKIDLDSSKIRIGLGTQDYETYSAYARCVELQPLLHAMLIFPALVYVFETLRQDDGEDNMYQGKAWFMALEQAYKKRGVDLMEDVHNDDKTSYQLAQEALVLPISKAMKQIPTFFSETEEDSE